MRPVSQHWSWQSPPNSAGGCVIHHARSAIHDEVNSCNRNSWQRQFILSYPSKNHRGFPRRFAPRNDSPIKACHCETSPQTGRGNPHRIPLKTVVRYPPKNRRGFPRRFAPRNDSSIIAWQSHRIPGTPVPTTANRIFAFPHWCGIDGDPFRADDR